jgi:hypothetical protein
MFGYSMLNGIVNSQKVRAQKVVASSQSTGGNSFMPHRSEDRLVIERLKESLSQRDKAMRQRDNFYVSTFAQLQAILQVS